ncbi:MAG: adenylyltransferase/cytidyltransferase family protein [Candidatus Moranbacteria bacterium]|nr:adenylyltransferase/cytidyltransferase family protein [Candidatus Moranbacteria bacterium]
MKPHIVYPGTFSPPTYGHYRIVQRAAALFPEMTILCSSNPEKTDGKWFSQEESKALWENYDLPENVTVETLTERKNKGVAYDPVVMVRGIRDEKDMPHEQAVMKLNNQEYGIDHFFYIFAEKKFADISSSKARQAAQELDLISLAKCVPPKIVTMLLEKVLDIDNLFMVVGRPGAGKSTFLNLLNGINGKNVHVDTDIVSKAVRPLITERFGADTDLVALAIDRQRELNDLIAERWLRILADTLKTVPKRANVFLEIPYGLNPGKELFRYVGSKVLYIGCETPQENAGRIVRRGNPEHVRFIESIPDKDQSSDIARNHGLQFLSVDSSGELDTLRERAVQFLETIDSKGGF